MAQKESGDRDDDHDVNGSYKDNNLDIMNVKVKHSLDQNFCQMAFLCIQIQHIFVSVNRIFRALGLGTKFRDSAENGTGQSFTQEACESAAQVDDTVYSDLSNQNFVNGLPEMTSVALVQTNDHITKSYSPPKSCQSKYPPLRDKGPPDKSSNWRKIKAAVLNKTAAEQNKTVPQSKNPTAELNNAVPQSENQTAEQNKTVPQSNDQAAELNKTVPQSNDQAAELNKTMPQSNDQAAELNKTMPQSNDQAAELNKTMPQNKSEDQGKTAAQSIKLQDPAVFKPGTMMTLKDSESMMANSQQSNSDVFTGASNAKIILPDEKKQVLTSNQIEGKDKMEQPSLSNNSPLGQIQVKTKGGHSQSGMTQANGNKKTDGLATVVYKDQGRDSPGMVAGGQTVETSLGTRNGLSELNLPFVDCNNANGKRLQASTDPTRL